MNVVFKLGWSDIIPRKEWVWRFPEWDLPIPRKGESIKLWATYTGENDGSLKLHTNSKQQTLLYLFVEGVTYDPSLKQLIEINVSNPIPVMKD